MVSYSKIPLSVVVACLFVLGTKVEAAAATAATACDEESCEKRKDGSFCGRDGVCRPLTCENWYEFGPLQDTGYSDESEPLICKDIPETFFPKNTLSLIYGCGTNPYTYIEHGYNRKCTAKQSSGEFNCFSIHPRTDFGPFLEKTQAYNGCADDKIPEFSYLYHLTRSVPIEPYGYDTRAAIFEAHNNTKELDRNAAVRGTIWASYTGNSPKDSSPTVTTTTTTSDKLPPIENAVSSDTAINVAKSFIDSGATTLTTMSHSFLALAVGLLVISVMAPLL